MTPVLCCLDLQISHRQSELKDVLLELSTFLILIDQTATKTVIKFKMVSWNSNKF